MIGDSRLRAFLASTTTPAILFGCMPAWYALVGLGLPPVLSALAVQGVVVGVLMSLEVLIPHPGLPPRPPGLLHVIVFYAMASAAVPVILPSLVLVPVAARIATETGLGALWPTGGPAWLHVVAAVLIVDFTSYWWHRLEHRPPPGCGWMWRLHSVHHAPRHFDVWVGPQVHPLDTLIFALIGFTFVALLGAPPIAVEAAAFFASVVGVIHHLRADTRCGWLNRLVPMADNHVLHHSLLPEENGNYGNITTVFDQLFGTYIPARRDPPPTGAWSLVDDYPQRDVWFQLASPFGGRWTRAARDKPPPLEAPDS